MFRMVFILIGLLIIFSSFEITKSAQKKIDKTIKSIWNDVVVVKEEIVPNNNVKLNFTLNPNTLFKLKSKNTLLGYLYLDQANSKADKIDYMVIFKPNLSIQIVQVLVYREDYGGEIGSKRWLNQFNGKAQGKEMKFGEDIQGISGATISARSITNRIKKLSENIQELRENKEI